MAESLQQIGRLAIRVEGECWNAYYAMPETMENAILLGSIRMGAIVNNPDRQTAFLDMMRDIVADIIEEKTGHRPVWGSPHPAPELERGGSV
ncbi:MAG: hypothetical protein KGL39_51225 [Patescibacteria group bacterium]|nr:hypothetical protein [Patescibacteria group bacterium]